MSQDETKAPLTAAERKAAQRRRDASRGYVEITVRCPVDRTDEVRQFAAKLKPRASKGKGRDKSQSDLFETERSGVSAGA